MNIDLHVHAKLTKRIDFEPAHFEAMLRSAAESGLDAIAVTEHFNTVGFRDVYSYFDDAYSYDNGLYVTGGPVVLPGMEVDVAEGAHMLLVGERDAIINVHQELSDFRVAPEFVPALRLLDLTEGGSVMVGVAHPLREGRELSRLGEDVLSRLSFLDLNAKDLYRYGEEMRATVDARARDVRLAVVGGSDAHHPLQLGSVTTVLGTGVTTGSDVREAVVAGRLSVRVDPCLRARVRSAIEIKRVLKRYRYGLA